MAVVCENENSHNYTLKTHFCLSSLNLKYSFTLFRQQRAKSRPVSIYLISLWAPNPYEKVATLTQRQL